MAKFKYSAIDTSGQLVTGVIASGDEREAMARLRPSVRTVNSLSRVAESGSMDVDLSKIFGSGMIKPKPLAMLCSQLSIILEAGLPVMRAVELVADQTEDKKLREVLEGAVDNMDAGHTMADSFERAANGALPVTFIETVRAGESSGSLVGAFRRLHSYFDRTAKTSSQVKSALVYPSFIIVVAIVVVVIIMVVAVPIFRESFMNMGTTLPWPTRVVIATSDFFVNSWQLLLLIIGGVYIGTSLYKRSETGRLPWSRFQLRIPVLGRLRLLRGCGEFASTLSTLLAAGLPVTEALHITARTIENAVLGDAVEKTAQKVEEGRSVAGCLRDQQLFPNLLVEMTGVGEESGRIEDTLDVIGDYYDNEAATASQRALALLEPITIVLLAGVVALILLAVYLPMFSLYGSIG